MNYPPDVVVRVVTDQDHDRDEVTTLTKRLRSALLTLDVADVQPVSDDDAPEGAKSGAGIASALGIRLAAAGLAAIVRKIRDWARQSRCSVEVTIDGDTVKITGASKDQQDALVNVWLARHARSQ
jgi:uncharacterized protein YajQ (UPF0234 family)